MDQVEADRLIAALAGAKLPTTGLKWRSRKNGKVPYWQADEGAIKAGYPVKSANLDHLKDPTLISQRCMRLQDEMLEWGRSGGRKSLLPEFDYSFGALIELYISDPKSPFNDPSQVDPNTQRIYGLYAKRLKQHIGEKRIDESDGRDVQRWFEVWADRETPADLASPYRHLPRGKMVLTVLKAAISFGIVYQRPGAPALQILKGFQSIVFEIGFPGVAPRTQAPTAAHIESVRSAARAAGRPLRALAYALQYETQARQWDVIGKWVRLSDPRPSEIFYNGKKWIGPRWSDIGADWLLTITPSKTRNTTGAIVSFDLSVCPMVMEEIGRVPLDRRKGPLIVSEATGRPYAAGGFEDAWQSDFAAAGIPKGIWNRDLRAGGNTEASRGGARKEDRAKLSGHSERINARVYDRDAVEAHRRVMDARLTDRAKNTG